MSRYKIANTKREGFATGCNGCCFFNPGATAEQCKKPVDVKSCVSTGFNAGINPADAGYIDTEGGIVSKPELEEISRAILSAHSKHSISEVLSVATRALFASTKAPEGISLGAPIGEVRKDGSVWVYEGQTLEAGARLVLASENSSLIEELHKSVLLQGERLVVEAEKSAELSRLISERDGVIDRLGAENADLIRRINLAGDVLRTANETLGRDGDEWGLCDKLSAALGAAYKPAGETYYDKAGTLRNADGSRSTFDDLDACESCGMTHAQRAAAQSPERCPACDAAGEAKPAEQTESEAELLAVMDAVAEALGDAYDCTRQWAAWSVGTMSQDDFVQVAESGERLAEIASAAISAMRKTAEKRCEYCDGTGDVHRADGEWLGVCQCPAGDHLRKPTEPTNNARYERLRILGVAPHGHPCLDRGTVLRFQSLDAFVDADLSAHPSRGEADKDRRSTRERVADLMGAYGQVVSEKFFNALCNMIDRAPAAALKPAEQTAAARDVLAERHRQISAKGWTPEHDDMHSPGALAAAAACYAMNLSHPTHPALLPRGWPWDSIWWKPSTPRRDMVKACALGLAAIERMDRAEANNTSLYAIHIPGPDEIYAMPSKEVAEICAEKHNAAMGKYLDTNPLDEFSPSRESITAKVVAWEGTPEGHAEALADFKAEEWGVVSQAGEGGKA